MVEMLAILAGLSPSLLVVKMLRYALEMAPIASLELQSSGFGAVSLTGLESISMTADSFRLFM